MHRELGGGDEETTFRRQSITNNNTSNSGFAAPSRPFVSTHNRFSTTMPHRIKRFISQRPTAIWWTVVAMLLLFLVMRMPSSLPRPQKPRKEVLFTYDLVEYQDTSEITDYVLLDRLLKGDQDHPIQFNRQERTPQWVSNTGKASFAKQLQQQHRRGHRVDELEELTRDVKLPYVDEQTSTVSVTAIVYYGSSGQALDAQLQAVFSQSVVPQDVWIVCTPATRSEVKSKAVAYENNKRLHIMAWDPVEWLQIAARAPGEFIWIIDPHIAPGKRYLEHVLRLAHTDAYRSALLGTHAMTFHQQPDTTHLECAADVVDNGVRPTTTHAVDMISDLWLIRRAWLAHVKTPFALHYDPDLFGYALCRSLHTHAGIPSIMIPSNSHDDSLRVQRLAGGDMHATRIRLCQQVQQHVRQAQKEGTAWQEDMIAPTENDASIVFVVDGVQQLRQIQSLLCRFVHSSQRTFDIHMATADSYQGLSVTQLHDKLHEYDPECAANIIMHDLNMGYTPRHLGLVAGKDTTALMNHSPYEIARLVSVLQPRLVIHLTSQGPIARAVELARDLSKTTTISLPARDVQHVLWAAELPLQALEQWNSFSVKLVIVTDRRPHTLARLLRSAARAHYFGDTVDVSVVMEQTSDRVTQTFVSSVPWPHGTKDVRHRITRVNEMPVHVEAWYPAGDHEYGILLDDTVELSPLFYAWAKYAILRYRYASDNPKDAGQLLGVSLYAPRLAENDAAQGRQLFDPSQVLMNAGLDPKSAYTMQAVPPGHSGTLYFPEHWREFHDYISARVADMKRKKLQNIQVPNARSSQWENSWRRYMDELLYMRGYVVLYPNIPNGASLSTLHLDLGSSPLASYAHAASLFRVPLLGDSDDTAVFELPRWNQLPVLDMWGQVRSLDSLVDVGTQLQRQVSACTPLALNQHMHDPSDMLCPPARLVEIPVPVEQQLQNPQPPPDYPTRTVIVPADSGSEPTYV